MVPDEQSWWLDGLWIGPSRLSGLGIFTSVPISCGAVVIRWGGTVFSMHDIEVGAVRGDTVVPIDEGKFLASAAGSERTLDDYLNHSCDPNLWMCNAWTLEARRPIAIGEELVADYAFFFEDVAYVMPEPCNCSAARCRGAITGRDWLLDELFESYGNHFSPFVNRRISKRRNP